MTRRLGYGMYTCMTTVCVWKVARRGDVPNVDGRSFKESSGFELLDKSVQGEKEIEKFKKSVKDFEFIKV